MESSDNKNQLQNIMEASEQDKEVVYSYTPEERIQILANIIIDRILEDSAMKLLKDKDMQ